MNNQIDIKLDPSGIEYAMIDGVKLFNEIPAEDLSKILSNWTRDECVVIKDALTPECIELIDRRVTFDDAISYTDPRQFFRVHNDPSCQEFVVKFHHASLIYYRALFGRHILQTYAFAMKYVKNSDLRPHYDNWDNPISSTVCYKLSPNHAKNPIYIDRAKFNNPYTMRLTVDDKAGIPSENIIELDLSPGDVGIFRGRNHLHWRDAVDGELDYRALLMHYSDYQYQGEPLLADSGMRDSIQNVVPVLTDIDDYTKFRRDYAMYF